MAYCTQADIVLAIPEATLISMTDDAGTGAVVAAKVTEAIAAADSEIDGYCESRYSVPFATVPGLIKKCSVDIAIYNLYSRWSEDIPETRAERYENARRLLEKISEGKITLGAAAVETPETSGAEFITGSERSGGDRLFTRDKLSGM